jgi:hypothetical protein
MPLSEISFNIEDSSKTHQALLEILKRAHYQVKTETPIKITAEHKLSFLCYAHKIEVKFNSLNSPQTNDLIKVNLTINHWAAKAYLRRIAKTLIKTFPGVRPVWINHKPPEPKLAKSRKARKHVSSIGKQDRLDEKQTWQCWNCGFENDDDATVCAGCGVFKEAQHNAEYGGAGANDFGYDPLWDDDQDLM